MAKKNNQLRNILIGIAIAGGAITTGIVFWKKYRRRKVSNQSLNEGDPATYARQLIMAFENDMAFGWGTDEEQVYAVYRKIPSQSFYKKVQDAYMVQTRGGNLNDDLSNEVSSAIYNELIQIVSSKPR